MTVKIFPSRVGGETAAPPSKSVAHRALICGALSKESVIRGIAPSDDVSATIGCLRELGAKIEPFEGGVRVGGCDPRAYHEKIRLFAGESGSTLRFLIPLCLFGSETEFFGSERLFSRPLSIYEDICKSENIVFERKSSSLFVSGRLKGGKYSIAGNISSQFITGIMLTLPLIENGGEINITGDFESESYVNLTAGVMRSFGINIARRGRVITVPAGEYQSRDFTVEGDCSNAAALEAFNLLGGDVKISGVPSDTKQGDIVYKKIYAGLAAGERRFDLSDCPDLAPVLFAAAAASGGAEFTGTARLRFKESDRAAAMREELAKFSVPVKIEENSVTVGGGVKPPSEKLSSHNDHRIVMALSLLASVTGGEIEGAEAVKKSFPDYFSKLKDLGVDFCVYDA